VEEPTPKSPPEVKVKNELPEEEAKVKMLDV
jgi:hypothetical protein